MDSVEISDYNPNLAGGERLFAIASAQLHLRNCHMYHPSTLYGVSTIQLNSTEPSSVHIEGGAYAADDPFWFIVGSGHRVVVKDVLKTAAGTGVKTGWFKNVDATDSTTTVALTYSATIATDASLSQKFTIAATNGTAFTISNPTNPVSGRTLTYDIKNSSGGVMGAITWGAAFLLAGAFTNPADTKRRTISFYYDGTNWVETNRGRSRHLKGSKEE